MYLLIQKQYYLKTSSTIAACDLKKKKCILGYLSVHSTIDSLRHWINPLFGTNLCPVGLNESNQCLLVTSPLTDAIDVTLPYAIIV